LDFIGALAAQVTIAGGFGFLSAGTYGLESSFDNETYGICVDLQGYDSVENLKREIAIASELLHVDINSRTPLPIGVGFLVWQLERSPAAGEKLILAALESRVKAIWLSFGSDLGRWINFVRENDSRTASADACKIFIQTSITDEVIQAVQTWKVDVIVAQGAKQNSSSLNLIQHKLT